MIWQGSRCSEVLDKLIIKSIRRVNIQELTTL